MAKSSSTRHRERKKSSPSTYFKESKFDNSSKTLNADLSPTVGKISQNFRNQWLWRCFIFTLLMFTGIISLYFDNNSKFFPRTWSSIMAGLSGTPKQDAEVPCSVMDTSTVDHRSNLTLAEFIRCYDAKRYSSFDKCKLEGKICVQNLTISKQLYSWTWRSQYFFYDTKSRCNEQNGGATQVVWHCDSFHQFFLFRGGGGQGVGERSGDLTSVRDTELLNSGSSRPGPTCSWPIGLCSLAKYNVSFYQ